METKTYDITVNYQTVEIISDNPVISTGTLTVRRNANSAGSAICAVVSIIDSLSNDYDEGGNRFFEVLSVVAANVV